VYFPPQLPESLLLPDGSDREQAPDDGSHLVRRMWAGGSVTINRGGRGLRYLHPAVLDEVVDSAEPRGEKLFVWFTRRMFSLPASCASWDASDDELRLRLSAAIPDVVERRCIVYLPARPTTPAPPQKVLKPRSLPEFCYEFTPTQHLLLRFSALTFNAHRIHYDADFSTRVEGYPANLCHGPLALAFLLEMAGIEARGNGREVRRIEYRCLAPMFVDRSIRLPGGGGKMVMRWRCGRRPQRGG
jgi:hydroxyacyl-ACP dehydratase HTD2-like protein with hotdog domain